MAPNFFFDTAGAGSQKSDTDPLSDRQICLKLGEQPQAGIRLVYERYATSLLRFVYRFTESQETAEEILHDVFLDLLAGKFRLQDPSQLKSWLFVVAKNKALNFKKKKSREILSDDLVQGTSCASNLEEELLASELKKRFDEVEFSLPEQLKVPWLLRREGKDNQQIADALRIPLGTVKSRFFRLVEIFKKELDRDEK